MGLVSGFYKLVIDIWRLLSENCRHSSHRSWVVEIDEFAVFPLYIFVSFGNSQHYCTLRQHPWISADSNKDDLEWPWMPDTTCDFRTARLTYDVCCGFRSRPRRPCVTEWIWALTVSDKNVVSECARFVRIFVGFNCRWSDEPGWRIKNR